MTTLFDGYYTSNYASDLEAGDSRKALLGKPNSELFCIIVHSDTDLIATDIKTAA